MFEEIIKQYGEMSKSDLEETAVAINELFRIKFGRYPATRSDLYSETIATVLSKQSSNSEADRKGRTRLFNKLEESG